MEIVFPVSMLAIGLLVGTVSLWFITRTKLKYEFDRGRAQGETDRATLTERLARKEDQLRELRDALDREVDQGNQLRAEASRTMANFSALQTRLEEERKASQEKLALLSNAEEKLTHAFKAISADALRNNNRSFLDLAKQNLESFQQNAKGELERRQNAIGDLIKPLKESLDKVDCKIGELEKTRAGAYSELREQVKVLAQSHIQLQSETGNLVKALRVPHIRGRWGEIQLRRVVELAGMLQYCDFVEQETVATEDSRIRPDVIVRLPGNRTIVVDSKVPFDAFYESISTTDDEIRVSKLKDHARLVRTHITALS
ncbi:MAG TPA: DNA recombination protein RmuC, partial [Pyrinomonadaceae bacterium]|nr:DNA recombination protein RmuC [Pyrinomonadaceae bacterium]